MRVLITGGFGYIGGRLGQYLHQAGHQVVLGTRQMLGSPGWLPEAEVVHTVWNDLHALKQICSDVDVIIHAAGMNAQDCAADPVAALNINGVATALLVEAAKFQCVRRFVYISTAHVYSSPLVGTITEDICSRNLHPYASSHRVGEDIVRSANQREEIEGIVIRLSNAFGAPMSKEVNCWMLLVNDLCCQAVTDKRMVLRSTGLQRRDFVTLSDTCGAIGHLLELPAEKLVDGVFNIGGRSLQVVEMSTMIQERCSVVLGFTPDIVLPSSDDDEVPLGLDYRIDRLIASGFKLNGDFIDEVDTTLLFCREAFGGCR